MATDCFETGANKGGGVPCARRAWCQVCVKRVRFECGRSGRLRSFHRRSYERGRNPSPSVAFSDVEARYRPHRRIINSLEPPHAGTEITEEILKRRPKVGRERANLELHRSTANTRNITGDQA